MIFVKGGDAAGPGGPTNPAVCHHLQLRVLPPGAEHADRHALHLYHLPDCPLTDHHPSAHLLLLSHIKTQMYILYTVYLIYILKMYAHGN